MKRIRVLLYNIVICLIFMTACANLTGGENVAVSGTKKPCKDDDHVWSEATCTAPKKCSVCHMESGSALDHVPTERNYQQASICTICGKVLEDAFQPVYEEYDMTCFEISEKNGEINQHFYGIAQNDDDPAQSIVGQGLFERIQTFTSDDSHPAKDGYEWKVVEMEVTFSENKWTIMHVFDDYYDSVKMAESVQKISDDNRFTYTVNYNGIDYDECELWVDLSDSSTKKSAVTASFLIPLGYDGVVVGTAVPPDEETEDMYIFQRDNKYSMFFRLK